MDAILRPSRLHPGEGCRIPLALTAPEGGQVRFKQRQSGAPVLLAEWQSEDGQATDLEYVVAPYWGDYPLTSPVPVMVAYETLHFFRWGLVWQHGRGKTASGQGYRSQFTAGTDAVGASTVMPMTRLRVVGHRQRIQASRLQLWVGSFAWGTGLESEAAPIIASIAPAIGPMAPPLNSDWAESSDDPCQFPLGAIEWRLRQSDPAAQLQTVGPDGLLSAAIFASSLQDWSLIPASALAWKPVGVGNMEAQYR